MKRYDKYKDSKVAWLGEIPKHWGILRAKSMFEKQNRPVKEGYDVVTCFRDGVVTLRKNRRTTGFTESLKEHGYQGVNQGDLVIHVMDAFAGAVGVSDSEGKATPVYSVCTAKGEYDHYYYAHIVRQMAKRGFIQCLYRGIRERSSDFKFDVFAKQYLPIPTPDEQEQIVRFLDWKVTVADTFVREKKREIELLKELRQAEINRAVTRGLDPDVPTRPCGIEWIGEIPMRWEVIKLGNIGSFSSSGIDKKIIDKQPLVRIINYTDVFGNKRYELNEKDYMIVSSTQESINKHTVRKGDLIFTPSSETVEDIGVSALVNENLPNTAFSYHVLRFQFNKDAKIFHGFKKYLCNNKTVYGYFSMQCTGTVRKTLDRNDFRNCIVIRPTLKEQEQIVAYVQTIEEQIKKSIEAIERQITLVTEYKTILINNVTTGKIDVRGVEIPKYKTVEIEINDNEILD